MLTKNNITTDLKKILSPEKVLTSVEELYAYSQDASCSNSSVHLPDAVVFVETADEVQKVVKYAKKHRIPIICRGAGTNVVGACIAPQGGIVLNFSRMNKILEISKENMTAKVQPGVIVGELQRETEKLGLFYPPDPSNLAVSTIGGSIAQSSSGARAFKYGSTKDYVLSLLVVKADGEIMQTGSQTIKNAAGYNLGSLFIGSEGTLGVIVEAVLKLIPKPQASKVIMAYFDEISQAVTAVNSIIEQQIFPATLDFMDKNSLQTVEKFYPANLLCDKEAALIIEVDGYKESVEYQKDVVISVLNDCGACAIRSSNTQEEAVNIWTARRSSMAACSKLKPNVITDDVIVPRKNIAELVKGVRKICKKYNLTTCIVGHIGDGSIHPQIALDVRSEVEYNNCKKAKSEIYDLTVKLNGSLSGEHGIGLEKREFLHKTVNQEALNCMSLIKKTLDPNNILNPYKIF